LRILHVENMHKIEVLMKMCGRTEEDLVAILNSTTKNPPETSDKKRKRSIDTLEKEVAHLEHQLMEQEKFHRDQIRESRESKKKSDLIHSNDKDELRKRISDHQQSIVGLENEIQNLNSHSSNQKLSFRKIENKWLNEKTVLVRKLQFFEKFGTLEGTHTENRLKERTNGGKKLVNKVQKLEKELDAKDRDMQVSRQEILQLSKELGDEKIRSEAAAKILAKKTKTMTEQVNTLNERFEKMEQRKSLEVQGYKADIKILRSKLSQLENKLLAAMDSSSKENENKDILEQLLKELKLAKQKRPKQWIT